MSDRSDKLPERTDGGAAFPHSFCENCLHGKGTGMSLRDYLAAKSMAGHRASSEGFSTRADDLADYAYIDADAMLERRKR